ncbi:MAG: hypothetical protein ACE5HU_04590, partial [Acidobacteriota bacterium]
MMRRRDRGGTGPALAAVALYAALGVGAGRADPGRLVIAEDEAEALVLRANGAIDRIDLASSEVQSIAVRTGRSPLTAIALPEAGRPVYGIATAEDPRRTDLLALDPSTGEVVRGWQVRGRGRFLHVTRDGAFACIVGLKPGARNDRPGHWMLTVVNLNTGATSKPLALGMKPLAGALRSDDPAGPRLFLAGA